MATATTTKRAALALLLAAVLAACGGGDVPATGAGIWKGTADGRAVTTVVLPDGSFYMMYSGKVDAATVGGGVQGAGALTDRWFVSSNSRDYNLEGAGTQSATVAATLARGDFLNGTVTSATTGAMGFQTDYSTDSDDTASLATLAGAYPGNVTFALGVRPAVFNVTAQGAVSTVINGCTITGTVAPRTDVNAYDLTIMFAGAPCVFPNASFSGVAYLDTGGKLSAFVRHAQVPQAIFFVGTR